MAGPDILQQSGNDISYPTWSWPGTTALYVEKLSPNKWGSAAIHAGIEQENLSVPPGGTVNTSGSWAGAHIVVTNSSPSSLVPLKVWTV